MRLKKSTKQFILSAALIATVFVIGCNNAETTTPASTEVAPAATTEKNPPDTATIRPPKPPTATSPAQ